MATDVKKCVCARRHLHSRFARQETHRACQAGFLSISGLLLLTVMGIVTAALAQHAQREFRVIQGHRIGADMAQLSDVVQEFVLRYPAEIKALGRSENPAKVIEVNGTYIHAKRFFDGTVPSWEINQEGLRHMATGVLKVKGAPLANKHALRLRFIGLGEQSLASSCSDAAGRHCSIETLLYRTDPMPKHREQLDYLQMHAALRVLGPGGAFARPMSPKQLTFGKNEPEHSYFIVQNPVAGKAGIIAVRGLYADQHRPYLNVDTGDMHGDINTGNHHITDIKKLHVGDMVVGDGTLDSTKKVTIKASSVVFGDASIDNQVTFANGIIEAAHIAVDTIETPAVIITSRANAGSSCVVHGLAANEDGDLLFCNKHSWQTLTGPPGKVGNTPGVRGRLGPSGDPGEDYDE